MTRVPPQVAQEVTAAGPARQIISVKQLLLERGLVIPHYQRPYKWAIRNVNQLFADIAAHSGKSTYRLGTIVFHRDSQGRNIVDGQQRIVTLWLAVRALLAHPQKSGSIQLQELRSATFQPTFSSEIAKANVYHNYHEITRIIARPEFTDAMVEFLLMRCEVVVFELHDISEAFQFFDSQNARGKDLDPHDLLKAYHLREFDQGEEPMMASTVARWENTETDDLKRLFAHYLYRIRSWCRCDSARHFSKEDIRLFKGASMASSSSHPYAQPLRLAHAAADNELQPFPFQLDQVIINGRRFFEMVDHYQNEARSILDAAPLPGLGAIAVEIMNVLNSYSGRNRAGDVYVRQIFDCLLLYYMDKFGEAELSRAIEKIFIWAYSLRLMREAVQLASIDKHVLEHNLFKTLREAIRPEDFLGARLPRIDRLRWAKAERIQALFVQMGYV